MFEQAICLGGSSREEIGIRSKIWLRCEFGKLSKEHALVLACITARTCSCILASVQPFVDDGSMLELNPYVRISRDTFAMTRNIVPRNLQHCRTPSRFDRRGDGHFEHCAVDGCGCRDSCACVSLHVSVSLCWGGEWVAFMNWFVCICAMYIHVNHCVGFVCIIYMYIYIYIYIYIYLCSMYSWFLLLVCCSFVSLFFVSVLIRLSFVSKWKHAFEVGGCAGSRAKWP